MSAEQTDLSCVATAKRSAVPLYFASAEHQLFAWLHPPAVQVPASVGVVICKPFGYEALCAHRSVRAFAETAAGLGVPALRFDYSGTGDSADMSPGTDQLEVWLRDVAAAVSALRRHTGVERVCLLGFRLGALLSTLAAARGAAVDALILVAPVLSGRRYLRELRTTELAAALAVAAPDAGTADDVQATSAGSMEINGYPLSAATIAQLSQIDLTTLAERPAGDILVIDRSDLPLACGWTEMLTRLGVRTHYLALPGFAEMAMRAPHLAMVPRAMLAATRDWLSRLQSGAPAGATVRDESRPGNSAPPRPAAVLPLPRNGDTSDVPASERPVWLASEPNLFGIVTEPAPSEMRRGAVILLNSGADHHIGASRMHVSLARRWARHGYVVLRMDLAGVGDSETRPGRPDGDVFPPAALEDVRGAIDFVRRHYGLPDLALGGLCSAAYHALRAAVAGMPVNRILMVNPQSFSWKEGMGLGDLKLADVVRELPAYREREFWKRLLRRQINLRAAARVVRVHVHRVRIGVESAVRDAARRLHIRLPRDLGWELGEITARGVSVVLVFAGGDPGIELLRIQGGSAVKRLGDRCRVHIIDSADHTFTQSGTRAALEQVLCDELFARHG
jgi:alpha-beta hydrolase superfamily lysophospholipase